MDLQVLLEIATTSELFVAVLACEGLLARVDTLVPDQVGHLAEGLATARAEIAAVVYQRVAGHASVADHLEALLVGEGLGATSEVGEINLFLP